MRQVASFKKCHFFLCILKCWVNLLTSDSVEYTSSSIWRHGSNFLTALIWPSRESFVRIAQNIPTTTSLVVVCTFYLVGKLAIKGGATQRRSHVLYVLLYELYQYILKVKSLKRFQPKYTRDQNIWHAVYELECLGHWGREWRRECSHSHQLFTIWLFWYDQLVIQVWSWYTHRLQNAKTLKLEVFNFT